MLLIAVAAGFLALLCDLAFLDQYLTAHPKSRPGSEHHLFSVVANALVSICAFASVVVFFKTRRRARVAVETSALPSRAAGDRCLRRMFKRRRLRLRTRSTSPNRGTHGSAFDEDLRHPREKECRPPRHGVMVPSYPQRQASTIHCRLIRVHAECLGGRGGPG